MPAVFAPEAVERFAGTVGLSRPSAEAALRRHLGICYDVCHGAVAFEDPVASLHTLRRAGIAVPKIQLSTALRIQEMTPELVPRLWRFDDGVYLHQVVVRGAGLDRFVDLPDALAAFAAGQARGEWRIHCHVPVFLAPEGVGSTQDALRQTLAALQADVFAPHLEVETYIWDVLPDLLKTGSKAGDIARELSFVRKELTDERQQGPLPALDRHPVQAAARL